VSSLTVSETPASPPAPQTSLFVNGWFPRHRALCFLVGALGGFLLSYLWSASLADETIGFNSADAMLGHSASTAPIGSIASGIVFAFVSGLAGSFTACNVAVFGAVGPLVGRAEGRRTKFLQTLRPVGWLTVGMVPVSALYGAIVGVVGTRMPQYSNASGHGITPRTAQSMIAFGVVGAVMIVMGLAALGVVRDPLARVSRRFPNAPLILMGVLIGGFLIGRPYPLFHKMFQHAANTHNPLYGAVAFTLQSIGNIIVMATLFLLLSYGLGGRVQRYLAANPTRASVLTATTFLIAGFFTVLYWDVRVLHRLDYIWFPTPPWT